MCVRSVTCVRVLSKPFGQHISLNTKQRSPSWLRKHYCKSHTYNFLCMLVSSYVLVSLTFIQAGIGTYFVIYKSHYGLEEILHKIQKNKFFCDHKQN